MTENRPDNKKEGPSHGVRKMSIWSYLYNELNRGYQLEHEEEKFSEKRKRVETFIRIPLELEKFMMYGFFQCLDAFLYVFTFLPIRFILVIIKLCWRGCLLSCFSESRRVLEPAQICDLLKGVILVVCCVLMQYVDVSMMYHIVRGQSIIKLYIFFNMLEVFDRLFSSFGQDILDALFLTATEARDKKRDHFGVIPHLLMALVYVFLHAGLVLFQATTLNVAFNSHNKALLTIMMSNNFVELKGSVFKKFEKNNLFQMSCSDVRERFLFVILLTIVCMRNMTEFSWNMEHLMVLAPDVVLVLVSEVFVDWIKHAFITKFNEISSDVYQDYTFSIAYDMFNSRKRNAFSDHLDLVSRRMGFIPLPLVVLMVRVTGQSVRIRGVSGWGLLLLSYLVMLSLKVLVSIVLLGLACSYIDKKRSATTPPSSQSAAPTKPEIVTRDDINIGTKTPTKHLNELIAKDQVPPGTRVRLLTPPSELPETSSLPTTPDDETMIISTFLNRSQSFSNCLAVTVPQYDRSPSITPKTLFSNSTVSLASVSLNEECILKDSSTSGSGILTETTSEHTELRHRIFDEEGMKKDKKPPKPLQEVDRFSMAFSDHLDLVSRRMGFIPLPLVVLMVRVTGQSVRIRGVSGWGLLLLSYLVMLSLKVLVSIVLLGLACSYIDKKRSATTPPSSQSAAPTKPEIVTRDDINIGTKTPTKHLNELIAKDQVPPGTRVRLLTPPSELPETSSLPTTPDDETMIISTFLNRSQSFSNCLAVTVPQYDRSPSITPKTLFSNSTVSLASVSLNEECILKDSSTSGSGILTETTSEHTELRHRIFDEEGMKKDKKPPKPLQEVDRFSMVSNRIV